MLINDQLGQYLIHFVGQGTQIVNEDTQSWADPEACPERPAINYMEMHLVNNKEAWRLLTTLPQKCGPEVGGVGNILRGSK